MRAPLLAALIFLFMCQPFAAQDAATGAIRGSVLDPSGGRIAQASIVAVGLRDRSAIFNNIRL